MKKNKPKTISLKEFDKQFSPEEMKWIKARAKYYELLFTFKHERKLQKISQEELAKKANINRTTLSQIETGQRNATIEVLMNLANALKMKLEINLR
jgi:DNA-binding XRE family transcriptional regulator